jgi:hypothetical protein
LSLPVHGELLRVSGEIQIHGEFIILTGNNSSFAVSQQIIPISVSVISFFPQFVVEWDKTGVWA